jgi:cell division transport system permease protein
MAGPDEKLRQRVPSSSTLLPEGRLTGPMPWVIAIMMFLTVLAGAAGLAMSQSAGTLSADLSDRITIQIAEADGETRGNAVQRLVAMLGNQPSISNVRVVPEAQLASQLAPWLGSDLQVADVPIPALVDADLAVSGPERVERIAALSQAVSAISPHARLEPHARYLSPLVNLVRSIGLLAFGLVALMAIATSAVVVLAARGAFATHRSTIDIMHMLGATDAQVARLFQRRMTLDAAFGCAVGFVAAVAVLLLFGQSVAAIASDLVQSVSLPWWALPALLALPLLGVAVAFIAARITLRRALERAL